MAEDATGRFGVHKLRVYGAKASFDIDGPKFLRITDVQDGKVNWSTVPSCEIESPDLEKYSLQENDIVFARTGATTGKSFRISQCELAVAASYLIRVRPHDTRVLPEFLDTFFQSPAYWIAIEAGTSGSAQGGFNASKLAALQIPIPDQLEQKRIVAILDQAFADIDKARALTEQNLKNARELFESTLQQVFSQRGEGWEIKPLESFAKIINGYAFKSGDFSEANSIKAIKITNVGVYEFVESPDVCLPEEFVSTYRQFTAGKGDVVIALTRTIISAGLKVAVVPSSYDGALVNQRVAAVKVDENVMPKELLQAFLSTKMAVDYVRGNVNELMQPNLSIKALKAFPVPTPPASQTRLVMQGITEIKEYTSSLVSAYLNKLERLDELKKSLLQKAFAGELTQGHTEAAA